MENLSIFKVYGYVVSKYYKWNEVILIFLIYFIGDFCYYKKKIVGKIEIIWLKIWKRRVIGLSGRVEVKILFLVKWDFFLFKVYKYLFEVLIMCYIIY